MRHLTQVLLPLFWKFGGIGLLVLGILDSSFLFAPLGNDLLVVAMTARYHNAWRMVYYSAMSTIGSILGCLLLDLVFRRAGEEGLKKHLPPRRLEFVRTKVNKNAAWALVVASIAPPPFPFTPFLMAASALQYPRQRMLAVVGGARMVRFTGLGILALFFGERFLRWAEHDVVQGFLIGVIVLSVAGSILSVIGWIRRSRRSGGMLQQKQPGEPAFRK